MKASVNFVPAQIGHYWFLLDLAVSAHLMPRRHQRQIYELARLRGLRSKIGVQPEETRIFLASPNRVVKCAFRVE
jgi:hypothetical protein